MIRPEDLPVIDGLPELLRFENGQEVRTPADWARRREELLSLYSEYMYGYMPDPAKESVSWSLSGDPETGGTLLAVSVSAGGRNASFNILAGLPSREAPKDGFPFWLEYWPWHFQNWFTKEWFTGFSPNSRRAMERGYAAFQYDWSRVAQDNDSFTGAFYDLYPYDAGNPAGQRGALLAWAWGISKVIDALEAGAGKVLNINPALSVVAGVSRFGKSRRGRCCRVPHLQPRKNLQSVFPRRSAEVDQRFAERTLLQPAGRRGVLVLRQFCPRSLRPAPARGPAYALRLGRRKGPPPDRRHRNHLRRLEQHGRPVPGICKSPAGLGPAGLRGSEQYDYPPGRPCRSSFGPGTDPGLL